MDVELQNTLSSAVLPIAPGRCSMKPTTISATSAITTTKTISARSFTGSSGGARKLSRTRIGLAGFFILGTIVIGPNVSRDASASPVDDSDGPSLPAAHDAPIGAAGTGASGAFLAPAFAADDVLGLPQGGSGRGGEQVTANLAANLTQPNAASGKTDGARGSCPTGMVEVEGD